MRLLDRTRNLPFALGLALLWLASALAAQPPPWRSFDSSTDGFRAEFPSVPEVSKNSVPAGGNSFELRSYVVAAGSTSLYIGVCDYGAKGAAAEPETMLSSAKQGAVEHMGAHILGEKKIALDAAPGIEYEAESDTLHFSVRMYIAGSVLYQVMVSSPVNERFPDAARFLDSFQLAPRPGAQVIALAAPAPAADWKPFASPADGFSASFPSAPIAVKKSVSTGAGTVELRTYSARDSSAEFIAAVCDYGTTAAGKDPGIILESAEKGAVSSIKGHLVSEKKISLGASSGVAFEAENDSAHLSARIYLAGNMLYQVIVASPLSAPYADTARFLDSFQLLPPQATH
ncbi:MAG: hypothetical protein ACLPY1_15415 [Terracidiphilus sp.]